MGRKAAGGLVLSDAEREALVALTRAGEPEQTLAMRAQIILECSEGLANKVVAAKHHVAQQTVGKWRARYIAHRLDGLMDAPRTGAPRSIDDSQRQAVIAKTRENLSQVSPRMSSRALAQEVGVSQATVLRIQQTSGVQPQRRVITQLCSDSEPRKKSRPLRGSNSTNGDATPASTASACETATPAAERARLKTNTSHTMKDLEKKSTEKIQRRVTGKGVLKTPQQADLSNPPTRKINGQRLAASSDPMTIIPGSGGRKTGEWPGLSAQQSQKLFKTMCDELPDGELLNLGQPLWNISVVTRLVQRDYGLSLARSTIARFLKRWRIIAKHPFEVGFSEHPSAFTHWAYSTYPKIRYQAKFEQGDIFWLLEDDIYPEKIPHPEGTPPLDGPFPGSHRVLSVIQSQLLDSEERQLHLLPYWNDLSWTDMPRPMPQKGPSSWLMLQDRDPTDRMQKFLRALVRLSKTSGRKALLIVPEDQFSSTAKLTSWLASVSDHIEVFTLPPFQTDPE